MKPRKEIEAEKYACGIGRNDKHGISSMPDTSEQTAFLAGWDCHAELTRILIEELDRTAELCRGIIDHYSLDEIRKITRDFTATHRLFNEHLHHLKRSEKALEIYRKEMGE